MAGSFLKVQNTFKLYLWPFSHTYVNLNLGFKPKKHSEEKSDLSLNFSNSFSWNYIDHSHEVLDPLESNLSTPLDPTYSHTSKTTCWRRSGNFWTMVTGCPEVKLTPYMGAVVL